MNGKRRWKFKPITQTTTHTNAHTCTHTQTHTHTHAFTRTSTDSHTHIRTRTHKHTHTHTCTHKRIHTQRHTHTHSLSHACTHSHTHPHTPTHTHTHKNMAWIEAQVNLSQLSQKWRIIQKCSKVTSKSSSPFVCLNLWHTLSVHIFYIFNVSFSIEFFLKPRKKYVWISSNYFFVQWSSIMTPVIYTFCLPESKKFSYS